jgi:hypothetical protein
MIPCTRLGRPSRSCGLLLVRWRSQQGREGGTVRSPIVRRCSEQGMLWWMRRLLLWRTHPWPHRDGAGLGIVEEGPHWGDPAVVVVAGAVVLAFCRTLAFAAVVGVGGRRERGRRRTRRFLLWWARRQLQLQRARSKTRRSIPRSPSGPARSP